MIWTIVLWMGMQGQKGEYVHANGDLVCDHYFPEDKVVCHAAPKKRRKRRILTEPNVITNNWLPISYKTTHSVILSAGEPKEGQILGLSGEVDAMGHQQLYWKYPDE